MLREKEIKKQIIIIIRNYSNSFQEESKEVRTEKNITLSPEALPYWNMIKDASPKVRDELKVFLINVSVSGAMMSYEENTEKERLNSSNR